MRAIHVKLLILAFSCSIAPAAGESAASTKPAPETSPKPEHDYYIAMWDPIVSLTDEQKKKIREICEAKEAFLTDFMAKHQGELKRLYDERKKAVEDQDAEAKVRLSIKIREVMAPFNECVSKSQERLENVLTPKQKATFEDHEATESIKAIAEPVELSPAQVKAVKAVAEGARRQAIIEVFTPTQRVQYLKFHALRKVQSTYTFALTPEQQVKAEAACELILKDTSLDEDGLVAALRTKIEEILTPSQKAIMREIEDRRRR